ncbi:MAG: GumC family protein [Armatimonadota bacterium]
MELWQYYRILRKRKWLIIIGTLICVGIVAGFTMFGPAKYEAYTTVMEKTSDNTDVDIFGGRYAQLDSKVRISNLVQLAMSTSVANKALDMMRESGVSLSSDPMEIIKTLNVQPVIDTMIVNLSVKSANPDDANIVASFLADAFIKRHDEINYGGATRSREFIESQIPGSRARLEKMREKLRIYKEESGVVMLQDQTEILVHRISQVKQNLSQYQVQTESVNARIKSLEDQLKEFPAVRQQGMTIQPNPVWQQLQTELTRQQIEMQRMLENRTELHPDVKALKEQIAETERKLADTAATIVGARSETVNPIRDSLVQNYVSSVVEYASADASRAAAQQVLDGLEPELRALPAEEKRLAQLSLEEDSARNTYMLLLQKLDEAKIREQESKSMSALQLVDAAQTRPADQRKMLKLILSLILSPILCAGVAFMLHYMDNSVKTPIEAEELLQMPVFAAVPLAKSPCLADTKCLPIVGTSYQMLSTNLWIKSTEMESQTILIASAQPDVGRSVTAANLAITLSRDGARVILVDSDLRQPSLHKIFKVENEKGLSNILAGQLSLKDALVPTSTTDLMLLPSGPLPANPVRLLRSAEMESLVGELNELADFVIFDSPAGITFADSTLLAALVKNVVIVQAAGSVPRGAEAEFKSRLEEVHANFIGAVLNMVSPEDSHGYYHFRSAYGELLGESKYAALPGSANENSSEKES